MYKTITTELIDLVEGEAPDLAQSVLQVDFLLVVELHHVKLPVNIDKSSESVTVELVVSVTVELVVSTGWMHPHLGKVESVVRDVKSLGATFTHKRPKQRPLPLRLLHTHLLSSSRRLITTGHYTITNHYKLNKY
jgi:hypothetical protein